MNKIIRSFCILLATLAFSVAVYAQSPVEEIETALANGNVNGVARYMDQAVVMTISGTQATYSKSQAEMILKDFFSKNPAKGYENSHKKGNGARSCAMGKLATTRGNYRTYFTIREKDGNFLIQEIRIEK